MESISEYQTTVSSVIRLYPIDIYNKYNKAVIGTNTSRGSVTYHQVRSSEAVKELKYIDAKHIVTSFVLNDIQWKKAIEDIAFIRKHFK